MNRGQISTANIGELLDAYRGAATQHGEATERGDHKAANRSADLVAAIYSELKRRGPAAQPQLLPLLTETAPGIRLWSAAHALELVDFSVSAPK